MRASGKTTRMLREAVNEAKSGKYVFVVAANQVHVGLLMDQAERLAEDVHTERAGATPKLYVGDGQISFETIGSGSFDPVRMKFHGAHPNTLIHVDHFAIEDRFAAILKEHSRYD